MWWTLTIRPTSSASFTQVCLLCIRVATKAFVWSLFLSLSASWLPGSLALSLASLWVWMFCTACRSEAHPACFVSCRSPFFDVSFPDVSYYFLRGAGRCFFGPANSGLHLRSLTLNSNIVSVCCSCLSVAWFHSVCLSVSLCFSWRCALRPALLCTVYDPHHFSLPPCWLL